jgi:hypothetical protein
MYYQMMIDWYKIYSLLVAMPSISENPKIFDKPIFCIVADGGFSNWSGSNILTTGVGGSETWVIEMTRYIKKNFNYRVVVFCNCDKKDIFEGVEYIPLNEYYSFIKSTQIHTCVISRFTKYIPVVIRDNVENIILVLHDISPIGNVIPIHEKIKKVPNIKKYSNLHLFDIFPSQVSIHL